MINKVSTVFPDNNILAEKLNEVIDFLNGEGKENEVEKACKQAIKTGSHSDLKKYLAERRKHI